MVAKSQTEKGENDKIMESTVMMYNDYVKKVLEKFCDD